MSAESESYGKEGKDSGIERDLSFIDDELKSYFNFEEFERTTIPLETRQSQLVSDDFPSNWQFDRLRSKVDNAQLALMADAVNRDDEVVRFMRRSANLNAFRPGLVKVPYNKFDTVGYKIEENLREGPNNTGGYLIDMARLKMLSPDFFSKFNPESLSKTLEDEAKKWPELMASNPMAFLRNYHAAAVLDFPGTHGALAIDNQKVFILQRRLTNPNTSPYTLVEGLSLLNKVRPINGPELTVSQETWKEAEDYVVTQFGQPEDSDLGTNIEISRVTEPETLFRYVDAAVKIKHAVTPNQIMEKVD